MADTNTSLGLTDVLTTFKDALANLSFNGTEEPIFVTDITQHKNAFVIETTSGEYFTVVVSEKKSNIKTAF